MRHMLWTGLLGLGVLFGATGQKAQAHWEIRTAYRYDPIVCAYVPFSKRVWVPDAVVVAAPPVVATPVVQAPAVVATPVVVVPRHHHHHHRWTGYYAAPVVVYPH
jgi:hypothetical protein